MNFDELIVGWKNYIFPNKEIEELAKKRLKICLDKTICEKLSNTYSCKICRCYMPAKVRSIKSKCPLRYW